MHAIILTKDMDNDLVRRVNNLVDEIDLPYNDDKEFFCYISECLDAMKDAVAKGNFTGDERYMISQGVFRVWIPGKKVHFVSGYKLDDLPRAVLVPELYENDEALSVVVASTVSLKVDSGTISNDILMSGTYIPDSV